ncbi:hypothetical protein QYZ88_007705 [Lachnospiraceae bacterium C1.1]|nr:hypothetical protein [Lachnospiraceae bacterium C1.1]
MANLTIFKADKEYDHQESKKLLKEVRDFFQSKLRIIVPEWITKNEVATDEASVGVLEAFFIEKKVEPIYKNCNCYDDLPGILDLFDERLTTLLGNMDELLDKNGELDDETKKSLDGYAMAVDKCLNVYSTQRKRQMSKFKELSTIGEIQDELRQLFSDIIGKYIIVLFDGLYERVGNNAGPVYEMVIREINKFLAENGVETKVVRVGDALDPELMEPTPDSAENFTNDFQKFDKIDEIRRYPYFFTDGVKICDGCARIWRRKD